MRREEPYEPNSEPLSESYLGSLQELVEPYPSVRLPEWATFDELVGGFRPREFSILCGATGSGKTTLLANLSALLLKQRVKHFVMSVETGHTDFVKRVMSVFCGRDLNTGEPVPLEVLKTFDKEHGKFFRGKDAHLALYDNRVSVERLKQELIHHATVKNCKVAFIDNLNFFMEVVSPERAVAEMDRVIHELIILCKQIDMHVIMVMHPKKTDGGRVESEFDIKGSSTAVQESHNVFLWNRPHPDDIKGNVAGYGDREIKFAKMRRRGKHVGSRLLVSCVDGVKYVEKGVLGVRIQ
jgi:archaellum biogenesis ATPase FlaH